MDYRLQDTVNSPRACTRIHGSLLERSTRQNGLSSCCPGYNGRAPSWCRYQLFCIKHTVECFFFFLLSLWPLRVVYFRSAPVGFANFVVIYFTTCTSSWYRDRRKRIKRKIRTTLLVHSSSSSINNGNVWLSSCHLIRVRFFINFCMRVMQSYV